MRTILFAAAALLTITSSSNVLAQNACAEVYGNCTSNCSSRPSSTQNRCMETCQMRSNECYQQVWGPRPQNVITNQRPADALATGDKTPPAQAPAPRTAPAPQPPR
jgi:hypothetical protein